MFYKRQRSAAGIVGVARRNVVRCAVEKHVLQKRLYKLSRPVIFNPSYFGKLYNICSMCRMKFGAVSDSLLKALNLRLPPEPARNNQVLSGTRALSPKVYVGAATWGDASWAGKIYPPKTAGAKLRQLYPQQFNAIELNATHYTIYSPAVLRAWAAPARGLDFKFCPKFPQRISHHSGFENIEGETAAFLESIKAFEAQLGPAFLQVSETFAPQYKEALYTYLASLPAGLASFLELRHPAWFSSAAQADELFQTLSALNKGLVITDTPGRRDLVHMQLTVPKLFLRFVCNGVHSTSFSRADAWIQQLQSWLDRGLQEAYVFLHPGNDAAVPELAAYWIRGLNQKCGLHLKPPVLLQPQLF